MMTDNKRVTNKQIIEALRELKINRAELDVLATKIVNKMIRLKSMEDWYAHLHNSELAAQEDTIEMSEEEDALGEAARLMTLMNLFQDKEEYEKCAVVKRQMARVNKILRKYK